VATNQAVQGHLRSLQELLPLLDKTAAAIQTLTPSEIQSSIKATLAVEKITDSTTPPIATPTTSTDVSPPIVRLSEPSTSEPSGSAVLLTPAASAAPVDSPTVEPLTFGVQPAPTTPTELESIAPPISEPLTFGTQQVTTIPVELEPIASEPLSSVAQPVTPVELANPPVNNLISSGMAATVAQAGSPQLDEADSIPNKFDQVLKSVGIKDDADDNPFLSAPPPSTKPLVPINDIDVAQLLNESDEEWDEWLLEEDALLSELSQASQEVAKDKIPDWDENWFAQPDSGVRGKTPSTGEDWEQFIPEYTDMDIPTNKGQANVERFRQNLVNDPQLMNELLAELDDIERLNKDDHPKS